MMTATRPDGDGRDASVQAVHEVAVMGDLRQTGCQRWRRSGYEEVVAVADRGLDIEPSSAAGARRRGQRETATMSMVSRDQRARHGDDGLLDELLKAAERAERRIGMHGADAAGVAGVPGLQHVEGFGAAHLADR